MSLTPKDIEKAENAIMNEIVDRQKEVDDLKKEILSLKKTLEEYGIGNEEISPISQVEFICISHIERISKLPVLEEEDVRKLDLLHKNLRMARGEMKKKEPKGKQESVESLLKLVGDPK